MPDSGARPLDGVRVVELTQLIAGPLCGRSLANLGATVVKVEPRGGERTRVLPPLRGDLSAVYELVNSGKEVRELDPGKASDLSSLSDLLEEADVFIENLSPTQLERWGVSREAVGPRSAPGIRCSFRGSSDPAQGLVDVTAQALSGMMWVGGHAGSPRRIPFPLIDVYAANLGALQIAARLASSYRHGWVIEVSLLESARNLQAPLIAAYDAGGFEVPLGERSCFTSPSGAFATMNGHVALSILDDAAWARLTDSLSPILDEQTAQVFRTSEGRLSRASEVEAAVQERLTPLTRDEALKRLREAKIPCAPVLSYADAAVLLPRGKGR